ncbi:hypothetical protein ABIA32_003302 [Streptacidiphilus sp. MAP12-20]|uniref:hypothetical protein n=1 Tax=Streptacidiphilus sp. MAP12-20 TaxID=3156299 RepID=UPI003512B976
MSAGQGRAADQGRRRVSPDAPARSASQIAVRMGDLTVLVLVMLPIVLVLTGVAFGLVAAVFALIAA